MALISVALSTSPSTVLSVPAGARKVLIHNPAVNAAIIAVKLDLSATALTFANGIQIAIGATLQIDLDSGRDCPMVIQGIATAATPTINIQTLGTV